MINLIIEFLGSNIGIMGAAISAVASFIFLWVQSIKKSEIQKAKSEQLELDLKSIRAGKAVDYEVESMSKDKRREELGKWSRKV